MSFKILALRIFDKTDKDLIKNLKPNILYQFYTDYIFKDRKGKIIIPYEENSNDVDSIEYKESVPKSLYGNNISVSAIVGKNGSGKSSLLELFYYLIHSIEQIELKQEFSVNLKVEIFYIFDNQIFNIKLYAEDRSGINKSTTIFNLNENFVYNRNSDNESNLTIDFYSIVLNYSIYGLNSEVMGKWIEKIFHKNDAYQVPIVINPMRTKGNIDINKEYLLAQSRLILYKYVISRENKNVVDSVKISKIDFLLDLKKCQYLNFEKEETLIIDKFIEVSNRLYSNSTITNYDKTYFSELVNDLFSIVKVSETENYIEAIIGAYENNFKTIKEFKISNLYSSYNDDLQLLCFLYIFKKIIRITENYEEYSPFNFLFHRMSWFFKDDWDSENISKFKLRKFIKNSIEIDEKDFFTLKNKDKEELGKVTLDILIENLTPDLFFNEELYANKTQSILNLFKEFLDEKNKIDLNNQVISLVNSKEEYNYESFYNIYKDHLINQINRSSYFLNFCFKKLIEKLNVDDSHITFKLKQALNYFKNDLFNQIELDTEYLSRENKNLNNSEIKAKEHIFPLKINQSYFENIREIEETPIAFFNPIVYVSKSKEEYEFNKLSSGEQQYIHSLLNVIYHINNIISIENKNEDKEKRVYRKVNLIFDEIELYFHPEYQRRFVYSLIQNLKAINKIDNNLEFNILLSTHSPFILSDIPSQNVLKLEDGIPVKNDVTNSFAANIHDLLADEFFMKNNIGEFASNEIMNIYSYLKDKDKDFNKYRLLKMRIKLIGEKVLQKPLLELLEKKYHKELSKQEQIKYYKEQIEKLNNE